MWVFHYCLKGHRTICIFAVWNKWRLASWDDKYFQQLSPLAESWMVLNSDLKCFFLCIWVHPQLQCRYFTAVTDKSTNYASDFKMTAWFHASLLTFYTVGLGWCSEQSLVMYPRPKNPRQVFVWKIHALYVGPAVKWIAIKASMVGSVLQDAIHYSWHQPALASLNVFPALTQICIQIQKLCVT